MSSKPSRSQYAAIPTEHEPLNDEEFRHPPPPIPMPVSPNSRRKLTALHVDEVFGRWKDTIAHKIKSNAAKRQQRKQRRRGEAARVERDVDSRVEIMVSVFEVDPRVVGKGKERAKEIQTLDHEAPLDRAGFDKLVDQVKEAIECDVQPRLNSKGSSGSYFARDRTGTTIGIFKPKDEEPYGALNPKLLKWLHRNFLSRVIPFGRACLIPQLSYLSEAAASLLDRRLEANIVPRTEVVSLHSPSFYYDWIDRERARSKAKGGKGRPLPDKDGSFQVFLRGFQDATEFLRAHPYPGRPLSQTLDTTTKRRKRVDILSPFKFICGTSDAIEDDDEEGEGNWGWGGEDGGRVGRLPGAKKEISFKWTDELCVSFREQLEKLVILDYLMRNTDRGLDNFMLKACGTGSTFDHMHLAAIDNSLSFPHQHPKGWRSYTYGWLYLPISLIGEKFSQKTRDHYLPLLSNPVWWSETTLQLLNMFKIDPDFKESMFLKQMAVVKGQGYNIVQSLRNPGDGPLELCRRPKRLVWDEFIEVADDEVTRSHILATSSPLPPLSIPIPAPASTPLPPDVAAPVSPRTPAPTTSNPAPSVPTSLKRVSSESTATRPDRTRRVSSVSSVLSDSRVSERALGSLTGVSILQELDRVEAEEREYKRSFGGAMRTLSQYEEEGESDTEQNNYEGERWGVRSENDEVRRSLSGYERGGSTGRTVNGSTATPAVSFDGGNRSAITFAQSNSRAQQMMTRQRSGSLSNLLLSEAEDRASEQSIYRNGGTVTNGDALDHDEDEQEGDVIGRKIVVVERMEIVADVPIFSPFC